MSGMTRPGKDSAIPGLEAARLPRRGSFSAIPTFLIIKKGEVVHQIVGGQPYEKFKQTVLSKI